MTIGQNIRLYRKKQKLTLRELGELSGFDNRGDVRIAQYESGSRIPGNDILERIAKALDVAVEDLAGVECRSCPYRRVLQCKHAVIHLEDEPGYETERTVYEDPDDEGTLYDNLD